MSTRRGSKRLGAAGALALAVWLVAGAQVAADQTIVVAPSQPQGWTFVEEIPSGIGVFTPGPGTPPLGLGSAGMEIDGTGREILALPDYLGLRFADITALQYSTYNLSATGSVAISLQFNVDYDLTDGDGSWQGRLVFEPSNAGGSAVANGVWQTWTPLTGRWWASGAPGNSVCPINAPCTWSEVLSSFPNAGIQDNVLGAVLLKAGGPWAPSFVGTTDALIIGTNGVNTTYDFEPCAGVGCADCNSNGVIDAIDIAAGTSLDLDTNGIPDECPALPANDFCPDATAIGVPSSTPGSTTLATLDDVNACGLDVEAPGVWYTVTGTGHTLVASVCTGTNFSPSISVYCDGCPQALSSDCCSPRNSAGCDDPTCAATICGFDPFCCGVYWDSICAAEAQDTCAACSPGDATCVGSSFGFQNCAFNWCSLLGVEYKILVHGPVGDTGDFTLTMDQSSDLCNDPVPCGPVGACCAGDTCTINTEAGCDLAGGVFQGLGTDCASNICERPHPGWNSVDVGISLTANQPTYWSAATGQPATGGVAPFGILDPYNPALGQLPGRPATDGSGERVLRGFVVAWAVNIGGEEIRWNHLKGDALIVNYDRSAAWEYNAYAFQAVNPAIANGSPTGFPGTLQFDGAEYDRGFDVLLLDFYASGVEHFRSYLDDTELTLMPLVFDLRQETNGPVTTKASFTIWNQNETKLTGLDRCVTCWDSTLLSRYAAPNHFLLDNLQTDRGRAQIDGLASARCDVDVDPGDGPIGAHPDDVLSRAAPLVGVEVRRIIFASGEIGDRGIEGGEVPYEERSDFAGEALGGIGTQTGSLLADLSGFPPPERPAGTIATVRPAVTLSADRPQAAALRDAVQLPVAQAAGDRASITDKGSLLIYPKVELRWSADGTVLLQDTFIDLTNDFPADVQVQMYFVNGDPPTS
ncbi:MAG: hypothetical protein H6816_03355 [Phycisphaerales bacterium]|nr:hypothetical protein [Phycisphaerales bacterium]